MGYWFIRTFYKDANRLESCKIRFYIWDLILGSSLFDIFQNAADKI